MYGNGGMKPLFTSNQRGWGQMATPMFHYRGIEIRETLDRLSKETGDPFEGIKMQVRNPIGDMPAYSDAVLPDKELADIYAFLQTLSGRRPAKVPYR